MIKEDLAEYIIKNLVFIALFSLGAFYAFSTFLFPEIQIYKDKQADLKSTQFTLNQAINANQEMSQKIKNTQQENTLFLQSLKTPLQVQQIQSIAQDFFQIHSLKQIQKQNQGIFEEITFELKGQSNGTQAFFDCINKLQTLIPNLTISLPFVIDKEDPLINTLKITLHLKVTQIAKKS